MSQSDLPVINSIFDILTESHKMNYIGEAISQLEHALQAAYFAQKSNASNDQILAALLHDIGHICDPQSHSKMGEYGVMSHEKVGADFLRKHGFSESVAGLVEGHVQAKRYLAWENPKYFEKLSLASRKTLEYQGGVMSEQEAQEFKKHPHFQSFLKLRMWDEQAKQVDLKVPDLEYYRPLFVEHLLL